MFLAELSGKQDPAISDVEWQIKQPLGNSAFVNIVAIESK